ncbi:DNA helicase PIF1, ATP-dependent [Tanacetum coccineum]
MHLSTYQGDQQNEVRNRTSAFIDKETSKGVDEQIVVNLIQMLDQYSSVAKAFCMARDWCNTHNSVNFHLRLHSERKTTRQYNAPTVSKVAALIVNDFGDGLLTRDIIVNNKDTRPERVSELHLSYMALQYPLLFSYGEDNLHEKIPYHNNTGTRKTKQGYVTVKEYYSYIIQQQPNKITRGDTSAVGLGKRIVLPRTFMGSPRYMMHNYQDAMALCQAYDNPDLFITFTSNLKWPKVSEMLAYFPGQKSHDRLEIRTHVLKIKIIELLDDLTKKHVFGESRGVVYVLEFQKRGLPHAHILLWLEKHCKCKTPSDIDDIISAKIPSLVDDPDGYKAFTNYMGVEGFEQLMTANKRLYATFKEACFAYGLLNNDKEYTHSLSEAILWALGPQLRDIFVTMLLFCDVSRPLKLWEWQTLSEDILHKKHRFYQSFQRQEVVQACINRSELWRYYKVFKLTRSMRVNEYSPNKDIDTSKQEFNQWVLIMGDGTLPAKMKEGEDEPTWIDIPKKFLIKTWDCTIRKIVEETYPHFTLRQTNDEYLKEKAILTPICFPRSPNPWPSKIYHAPCVL